MSAQTPIQDPPAGETGAISAAEERFERLRRMAGILAAPAAFFIVYWLTGGHVSREGRWLSAILAGVATLWVCETIPLPATSLLGAVLCIVTAVDKPKAVLAPFADPIVFLFIGSFILAEAMMLHGLDRRIALAFLSLPWVGGRPLRVLAALGAVTAALSMWVSNTATTAMMLPIALGILRALHGLRTRRAGDAPMDARAWPMACAMMLMIAYSASIGGIGTKVGSPPNLITVGQLEKLAGVTIPFFQWMALCLPLLIAMFAALLALLAWLHPLEKPAPGDDRALAHYLAGQRAALGPWSPGQVNTLIAFSFAVALWVVPGLAESIRPGNAFSRLARSDGPLAEAVVALVAGCLLFILPTSLSRGEFTITWRQAARIDWGTIILFGGGLALGELMFRTGVAHAMGRGITSLLGATSLWALTAVAIVIGILLSETTSNTASANMVVPVAIALAQASGVSPVPPALGACLGASYGFMLPVSTPPNAIVYGSGLVPLPKMVRAGLLFDIFGAVLIWAGLRVLCPLLKLC